MMSVELISSNTGHCDVMICRSIATQYPLLTLNPQPRRKNGLLFILATDGTVCRGKFSPEQPIFTLDPVGFGVKHPEEIHL